MFLNDICSSCSKVISKLASLKRIEIKNEDDGYLVNSNVGENSAAQANLQGVSCIVCDNSSPLNKQSKQINGSNVDSESQNLSILTSNSQHQYSSQNAILQSIHKESSSINSTPNYLVNSCLSLTNQSTLPTFSEQDLDEVFSNLNDEPTHNETGPDSDPISSLEKIYTNFCEFLFNPTREEIPSSSVNDDNKPLNQKPTHYNRPASSNENCLSPKSESTISSPITTSEQNKFSSPIVSNQDDDLVNSNCAGDRSPCNLGQTLEVQIRNKRSQSIISSDDDEENKKRKLSSSSESSQSDDTSLDPYLKLIPKVDLLKLPNFMIDSDEPASNLGQIYSSFTESLFTKRGITCVHRHKPKRKLNYVPGPASRCRSKPPQLVEDIEQDDSETIILETDQSQTDEEITSLDCEINYDNPEISDQETEDSFSEQPQIYKCTVENYDDEDTVEMKFNPNDHCVTLSSDDDDDEVSEPPKIIKSESLPLNQPLDVGKSKPCSRPPERIAKISPYFQLQWATIRALKLEKRRLRKIVTREKPNDSLFPNFVNYINSTSYINKSFVRVEIQKQLSKVAKLYQLSGITPG